ncbi:MAG: putative bifunctional diguanylate cyclase/phosphodiesterase [Rhizobiaceae bacterium]
MNKPGDRIPADIYIPFVESLFRDGKTLTIGIAAQTLLAVMVYWKTNEAIYLGVALALVVAGFLRLLNFKRFHRSPDIDTRDVAARWENEYIVFACFHTFALGSFCFVAIYWAYDDFAEIASVSVTLASATAIAGRNYGSPRMVIILILTLLGPITAGFVMRGDVYHVVLGLLTVPLLYAIRVYASTVRNVLFKAISEQKKANRLASRFDRALNTTPHGLIMLGPDGRIAVANGEAANLLSASGPEALVGRTLHALLLRTVAAGLLSRTEIDYVEQQLNDALHSGQDRKLLVSLANGHHYEFSARSGREELGVVTFEDVTSRVNAEEKIRFMAQYDSLTGLPNRGHFNDVVTELISSGNPGRQCALAVLDLDDFKHVNDTLGHPVGDGLIYAVADRLVEHVGENAKVSRFGGDEFIVYFDHVSNTDELAQVMDQLFDGFKGDVDVAGHSLRILASAGAVLAVAGESDVEDLIVKADLALYQAKDDGKNRWRLFEATMDAAFRARQTLKAELRLAVEQEELRVVYQPIVGLKSMKIASCEALCRWDHPELGSVSPSVFIPLAEEMGIVSEISHLVLKKACKACLNWPGDTSVSINLSANDFRDRNVVEVVRQALECSGLEPHRLEIEITETALLDDKLLTITLLNELKALGVRIALDDFGTGYSSLSYLHTLPLDKVKIDQAFLSDITFDDRSLDLLKGIVTLSRRLGLAITLEGVEDFEQLKLITRLAEPDLLQGFLFGSALSESGITTLTNTVSPFAAQFEAVGMSNKR